MVTCGDSCPSALLKVYMANNVNIVTKIRTEHLTEEEKKRYKGSFPMGSLKLNTTFWLSTAFFLMHLCLYFVLASSKGSSGLFLRLSVPFWSHEPFND